MPTTTASRSESFPTAFGDVSTSLVEASKGAAGASVELYLDGLDAVVSLQRRFTRGTPLEPLSDVLGHQAAATRELVQAYVSSTDQPVPAGRQAAEVSDRAGAKVARGTARAAQKATKRSAQAARKAVTKPAKPARRAEAAVPIAGYKSLTADELIAKLPELPQATLTEIAAYEKAHGSRSTVLERVAALRGPEPVPGYDELTVEDIQKLLTSGDESLTDSVRDYERRHKGRVSVLEAATERKASDS